MERLSPRLLASVHVADTTLPLWISRCDPQARPLSIIGMTSDLYLHSSDDVRAGLVFLRDDGLLPPRSLVLFIGDFHGFVKQAVAIDDVPDDLPLYECMHTLDNSLRALVEVTTVHGIVLAVSRLGAPRPTPSDLAWRDAFSAATAAASVEAYGIYLVTPEHVGPLGDATSKAA